ncbi:MAG: LytTR family DNA-binding domain-containing protein [Eubacteriales bacterium]|nr:LytTR family DNA-binding domain-containing protein [Eubacteriales bacterium]
MKLRIVICDDDSEVTDELRGLLRDRLTQLGQEADIRAYASGEAFARDAQPYDILFMDVYMPGKTGIDIVRETGAAARHPVVFITTSRDFAVEAFALRAAHYLLKPLTAQAVADALERCLPSQARALTVRTGRSAVSVPMDSIRYIEVYNKVSVLHTSGGDLETYTPLDALYEQLDGEVFMKAQRSYVVHMACIQSFQYDRLALENGKEIMLSRAARAELKAQYQRYLFRLARRGGA